MRLSVLPHHKTQDKKKKENIPADHYLRSTRAKGKHVVTVEDNETKNRTISELASLATTRRQSVAALPRTAIAPDPFHDPPHATSWATSGRGRMWRVRPDQEDEEDEKEEEEEAKAKRAASCGVSGPPSVSFLGEQT